jgi:hypothetical protein
VLALTGLVFTACDTGMDTPETPRPPSAPGGITAAANLDGIMVTWGAVEGAVKYKVYGTQDAETEKTLLATVNATVPYCIWTHGKEALNPQTDYRYTITALNAAGTESVPSAGFSIRTPAVPIGADPAREVYPTFERVGVDRVGTSITRYGGIVTLTWDPVPGAVFYKIYWTTDEGNYYGEDFVDGVYFPGELQVHYSGIVRAPATTYNVTDLTLTVDGKGHTFFFSITTVNMFGESDIGRSGVGGVYGQ